jgi:hypothetical protein
MSLQMLKSVMQLTPWIAFEDKILSQDLSFLDYIFKNLIVGFLLSHPIAFHGIIKLSP